MIYFGAKLDQKRTLFHNVAEIGRLSTCLTVSS